MHIRWERLDADISFKELSQDEVKVILKKAAELQLACGNPYENPETTYRMYVLLNTLENMDGLFDYLDKSGITAEYKVTLLSEEMFSLAEAVYEL